MSKKIKKFIFPGTTLIVSFYFSILFAIGIIAGYFGTSLFHKKLIKTGKVKLIILPFGKWKIHLHHWVLGSLIILAAYITNLISSLPIFFIGVLGGLIFHDLYLDKIWYKVIYKKKAID